MGPKYNVKKYSPIAPVALLELLDIHRELGDYLLFLAHDILEHEAAYHELAGPISKETGFIILDNSTVELGLPMSAGDLIRAAEVVNPDCVVLPDVMRDADATIDATRTALLELSHHDIPLMKIVQGNDLASFTKCIVWMSFHVPGHYWAVPRWIANDFSSRLPIIRQVIGHDPEAKIHLLGMSRNLTDDIYCTKQDPVMGIDSANPIALGQSGVDIRHNAAHVQRGDLWEHKVLHKRTLDNIRYIREVIQP